MIALAATVKCDAFGDMVDVGDVVNGGGVVVVVLTCIF
jgi:hypothetical protein